MTTYNKLQLSLYSRGTTNKIADLTGDLYNAQKVAFSKICPGGLYADCSFYIPRKVTSGWSFDGGQRLVCYNGSTVVWAGYIQQIDPVIAETEQGVQVTAIGAWGDILQKQCLNKPWVDNRIDSNTWQIPTSAYSSYDITLKENMTVSQSNKIRFTPKNVAFTTTQYHRRVYTAPTGQTIKRVTCNYDMQEAAQQWILRLYDNTGTALFSVTTSGTGSQDVTLASPNQTIFIVFMSDANQTPPSDGTVYGEISNVKVYTETGSINAQEIAKDVIGYCTDLNTTTGLIGACTRDLSTFITNGAMTYAGIIAAAFGFGGASGERWQYYCVASEFLAVSNGKDALKAEAIPSLTDGNYDYSLSLRDLTAGGISLRLDYGQIVNDVVVKFTDLNDKAQWWTSTDDASLKDTGSINKYGLRQTVVDIGQSTSTGAGYFGARYVLANRYPIYRPTAPIPVKGYINGPNGQIIPTSQIDAGKRLLIRDFPQDITGNYNSGTPLVWLISRSDYDDANGGSTMLSAGPVAIIAVG